MARVSVVMPVYNAAPYVEAAAASVLAQTHGDLQLLAIDDGSHDGSGDVLDRIARDDACVRVFHQPNAGSVAALNRGLEESLRGPAEFVAIMHADDLCLPTRFARQIAHFAAHPEVDICGTWMRTFGEPPETPGGQREWRYPKEPRFTKPFLLFWCCFAHPTMMFRRQVLEGTPGTGLRYDPRMPMPCEDYALWAEASRRYALGNVPEVLLEYRLHMGQGSAAHHEKARGLTEKIRRRQIERLGLAPTPPEMTLHQQLAESDLLGTHHFAAAARAWLERLWEANQRTRLYDEDAFGKVLGGRWAAVCVDAANRGTPDIWPQFWTSPLARFVDRTLEKNRAIPDPPAHP